MQLVTFLHHAMLWGRVCWQLPRKSGAGGSGWWWQLGTGKRLKRSRPHKWEPGTPTIATGEEGQCNRRVPEAGHTARCGEPELESNLHRINGYYCSQRLRKLSFLGTFHPAASTKTSLHNQFRGWSLPPTVDWPQPRYLTSRCPPPRAALVPEAEAGSTDLSWS